MCKEVKPKFTEETAPLGDMSEFAAPFAQPRYDVDSSGVWYIDLALSVWGSYEATKSNWDTTALGLQNAALARNDGFLALDEIGQTADPRRIPQMVYSVINGISKTQGAKDGGNRKQKTWRNLILSTGETNPESLIGDRAHWKAGNRARLPDIQAEAKHGIYDMLHGFTDGAKLSEHINMSCRRNLKIPPEIYCEGC